MLQREKVYIEMYNTMWKLYVDWFHSIQGELTWDEERCKKFKNGPIVGLYKERDSRLLSILGCKHDDDLIINVALADIKRQLQEFEEIGEYDSFNKWRRQRLKEELELLKDGEIDCWIEEYFLPMMRNFDLTVDTAHVRGFCFMYYDYAGFCAQMKCQFNPDTSNLKRLYSNIYSKKSELHTYGLIEMTEECELMPIDPPRFYDPRIDRTIHLSNVPKELLQLFVRLKEEKLYGKLSLRGSNLLTKVFKGNNSDQTLMHVLETGKLFSFSGVGVIPITKLYSTHYKDCLWIRVDNTNITFEELCENELLYEDAIVTQLVHMEYKKVGGIIQITHIDHEFVFYDRREYDMRINKADIKGEKFPRLKSFKIDNAQIPIDFPCSRTVTLGRDCDGKEIQKEEVVPFIVVILKSYFKHSELIDEYFEKLNSSQ